MGTLDGSPEPGIEAAGIEFEPVDWEVEARQESDSLIASIPSSPDQLGLPVPTWRPQQPFAIAHGIETLTRHGKKFWFLNGATGAGKSIIAAGLGRVTGLNATFLTHTIQLQQQYLDTMQEAKTATGKGNHECRQGGLLGAKLTAEDCESCPYQTRDGCGYYAQLFAAEEAQEVLLNYAYGTRVAQVAHFSCFHKGDRAGSGCSGCNPFIGRGMLVCDEGHLAENSIIDSVRIRVSEARFKREGFTLPGSNLLMDWVAWAKGAVDVAGARLAAARQSYTAAASDENLNRMRAIRRIAETLGNLADTDPNSANLVLVRDKDGVDIRPVWGWDDANRVLFDSYARTVIMSATLGDPKILARKLGIGEDEYGYLDLPSPFPIENRRVWRWPVAKLGAKSGEEDMRRIMQAIDHLLDENPDKKGIIHTASHKLTQTILARSTRKGRLTGHAESGRLEALERFKSSSEPVVLVSASFSTGLDLPGVIGFQIIPKVPYANLGDPVTKMRFEWGDDGDRFGKKNYAAEAMNTIVQAVGRGVRQASDSCATYILDANFNHLVKQAYAPKSFMDALAWR